jgi:hypothetical protein
MTIEADALLAALQRCAARALPDRIVPAVRGLVSISAGWESDVYGFDAVL